MTTLELFETVQSIVRYLSFYSGFTFLWRRDGKIGPEIDHSIGVHPEAVREVLRILGKLKNPFKSRSLNDTRISCWWDERQLAWYSSASFVRVWHCYSLLQREILEASVYFGLSSAVTEARRLFQQLMSDNLKLSADIRDIVYSTGKSVPVKSRTESLSLN